MASTLPGGTVRLDVNDPEDLQKLIDRGLIWRSGPKTLQKVFKAIQNEEVTRMPDREPPEVRAFLDKIAPVDEPEENPLMRDTLDGMSGVTATDELEQE